MIIIDDSLNVEQPTEADFYELLKHLANNSPGGKLPLSGSGDGRHIIEHVAIENGEAHKQALLKPFFDGLNRLKELGFEVAPGQKIFGNAFVGNDAIWPPHTHEAKGANVTEYGNAAFRREHARGEFQIQLNWRLTVGAQGEEGGVVQLHNVTSAL